MSTFGSPIQETPVDEQVQAGGDTGVAEIDINDPRLTSESLTDATDKDAYAIPPPAPDGFWRAKLSAAKIKNAKGEEVEFMPWSHPKVENGKPCFVTNVEAHLIDLTGQYDGTRIMDSWVKTLIDSKKGTSQISTIITKAGGAAPAQSTDLLRMQTLLKLLASEPEAIVETVWRASCQTCGEAAKASGAKRPGDFLVGMHRFPQRMGVADPNVSCPACKSNCRAQVRISRYYKIGEVKVTRGAAK